MNCRLVGLSAIAAMASFVTYADLVSRDIGDPEMNAWEAGTWVTCGGDVITLDERPSDAPTKAIRSPFLTYIISLCTSRVQRSACGEAREHGGRSARRDIRRTAS